MPTKTVRIEQDVYERIKAHRREDETFSETIDRLIDDWSLLELAGAYTDTDCSHWLPVIATPRSRRAPARDESNQYEEEAERHRELLRRSEETAIEDRDEMLERMGIDVELYYTVGQKS